MIADAPVSLRAKHGFEIREVPDGIRNPVVLTFYGAHLRENGYPLGIVPASNRWFAVVHGEGVYAVFGFLVIPPSTVYVDDFYVTPNRLGKLAAYAALEKLREDADKNGMNLVTLTPTARSYGCAEARATA